MSDVVFVVYEQGITGTRIYGRVYAKAGIIGVFEDYRKAKEACKGKSWRHIQRVEVR